MKIQEGVSTMEIAGDWKQKPMRAQLKKCFRRRKLILRWIQKRERNRSSETIER